LDEEMAGLEDPALYAAPEPREQYRRFKAHARMAPRELAVLREVTAWREEEARRRDRPRGHIVPDGVLLALAKRQPATAAELGGIQDLSRRAAGRYGEDLLAAVARGLALPEAACPPSPPSLGRRDPRKALADAWLEELRAAAAAAGIDASLLATRRNVTDLVLAGPDADPAAHPLLRGWRRELIGRDLREDL
jgi:ribonuclease D